MLVFGAWHQNGFVSDNGTFKLLLAGMQPITEFNIYYNCLCGQEDRNMINLQQRFFPAIFTPTCSSVAEPSPTTWEVQIWFLVTSGRASGVKLVPNHLCWSHCCGEPKTGATGKKVFYSTTETYPLGGWCQTQVRIYDCRWVTYFI